MLALSTTTITIVRPDGSGDPYEAATTTSVATGVRGHVSSPSGTDARVGGHEELVDAVLLIDATPTLQHGDIVTDELTGEAYTVTWVRQRTGLGMDHQKAGLVAVKGGSSG